MSEQKVARLHELMTTDGWNREWKLEDKLAELQEGDRVIVIHTRLSGYQFTDGEVVRTTRTQVMVQTESTSTHPYEDKYYRKNGRRVGSKGGAYGRRYSVIIPDTEYTRASVDAYKAEVQTAADRVEERQQAAKTMRNAWRAATVWAGWDKERMQVITTALLEVQAQ